MLESYESRPSTIFEIKYYPKSIIRNEIFAESNRILEGKARELRDNGKGHRPNRARALTEEEEFCGTVDNLEISFA